MLMVCSSLLFVSQLGAEGIGMVTGSSTGTYIAFGQDIAKVAQSVGLDILFASLTHPAMLQEYLASTIGPSDYPWLDETISTVAVKAMLISFNFSSRKNAYYQQRCGEISKLGAAIQANFAELQRTGHPKWRDVDLGQEIGIWHRDACSQVANRAPQQTLQSADDQLKAIVEILKGKGHSR
jgi:hypothetical protein